MTRVSNSNTCLGCGQPMGTEVAAGECDGGTVCLRRQVMALRAELDCLLCEVDQLRQMRTRIVKWVDDLPISLASAAYYRFFGERTDDRLAQVREALKEALLGRTL